MPPTVRVATRNDERALYALLVEMWNHNERGWGFVYSPPIVIRYIEQGTRPDPAFRSDPRDHCRAFHGVIEEDGKLVATVGIFLHAPLWYVDPDMYVAPTELWFYVSDRARGKGHSRALRDWSLWVHEQLRKGVTTPFPLITGFMNQSPRYRLMQALWERMWPRARQVGSLFWID